MSEEQTPYVTVDGVDYPIDTLTKAQQELINVHTAWVQEAKKQRLELAKTETAYEALAQKIAVSIRADQEDKAKAESTASDEEVNTDASEEESTAE